ncbi:AAA domain-containing protein [Treponema primitia]|uniref:DEAD/DEAH box helicase n=1 Tax=Treponema primitia TaxID=88058 RepID=UPI00398164CB
MTDQQMQWFAALTKDREENAKTLEKPSMRGVQRSVVDKYSDQAHFIYELLQNADDVQATIANFILKRDGLVFIHNGSIRFSITNPTNEEEDTESGNLGHINSITSIANSNKTEATIGKFGVGFKAVFQYTQTPHVYDPEVQFKIERFIVPQLLENDFFGRKVDETVFWFPFNHEKKTAELAYSDISEILKGLVSPTLFLSNINNVLYQTPDSKGEYLKIVEDPVEYGNITSHFITLLQTSNETTVEQKLWLFSRTINENKHPYCIGFYMENNRVIPVNQPAFCFFPTKENTKLKFIIHAPFLLIDSREGIKAGEKWNISLVQKLAELAADSLLLLRDNKLIDDTIINIIPYDESDFVEVGDKRTISFKPFYSKIREVFNTKTLLPANNKNYVSKESAYWFQDKPIIDIFPDEQLRQLIGTPEANWVFRSIARNQFDGSDKKGKYLEQCVTESFDMPGLLRKIDPVFIENQTERWLHKFYEYLNGSTDRAKIVRKSPIFLDQEGNAVSAYDKNDKLILFLPDDNISGYITVKKELLSNETTREFIEKKLEIRKPSLDSEIYNKLIPAYNSNNEIDSTYYFKKFFQFFNGLPSNKITEFIDLVKNIPFLEWKSANDSSISTGAASNIYYPSEDLQKWFSSNNETKFLCLDRYHAVLNENDWTQFEDFISNLGIQRLPIINELKDNNMPGLENKGNYQNEFTDKYIDGIEYVLKNMNKEFSKIIWKYLLNGVFRGNLRGIQKYHIPYAWHNTTEYFDSSAMQLLQSSPWILNNNDELISVSETAVQTLSPDYDTSSPEALALIKFLGIEDESESIANLNEEQIYLINLGKLVKETGASTDELKQALELIKNRRQVSPETLDVDSVKSVADRMENNILSQAPASTGSKIVDNIIKRIEKQNNTIDCGNKSDGTFSSDNEHEDETEDEDENTPHPVNYKKKIERLEDRSSREITSLNRAQEYVDIIASSEKYSFIWFKALLELEGMENGDDESGSKRISISFGKVEKEPETEKTIVLKHPNHYIPAKIEELSDIRLDIDTKNGKRDIKIESVSVNGYTLKARLKSPEEIKNIDLDDILQARIDVQSPTFLMRTLKQCFGALPLDDKYNLKDNLPENIEFIFGPPGTGKTTYLANNILIPFMDLKKIKILVLTPTNKAADVLTTRIMASMGIGKPYKSWLVRFGTTNDESIVREKILQDHTFNLGNLDQAIVVTTIARFTYDGFNEGDSMKKLFELNWDYIVFDEASMIHLANIIYPIFKARPKKFIIAGDPFQIGPIVSVEDWKDENIYTMVNLKKFVNPSTIPHDFKIINLTTQYRSVPAIGQVFSNFMYDGILKHNRSNGNGFTLKIQGMNISPLNIIKFPVSGYESIFRTKQLRGGSSYQSYSALFTFEFVKHLSKYIETEKIHASIYKIGIISPYRAQADLIDKLIASWHNFPTHIDVKSDTIHGFQGDECDIIIAVFNPPPNISDNIFLNRKNILNVSISRARDYLFLLMPDENTENFEALTRVRKIERLVKKTGEYSEIDSNSIEELILGNAHYLEENTFSTSHQTVNVYGKPEKIYEVRSEDVAIDVQLHSRSRRLSITDKIQISLPTIL